MLIVGQGKVQVASFEDLVVQFTLKFLESVVVVGDVTSFAFVRACDIAFSINFPIFSCVAVHACVILVMSQDTICEFFFHSYVIILHCCRITVD